MISTAPPPNAVPLVNAHELTQRDIPPPDWLVDSIIPGRGCTVLGGEPKTGKSQAVIDLALAVAQAIAGHDEARFLGHRVNVGDHGGGVLLIDAETDEFHLRDRLLRFARGRGMSAEQLKPVNVIRTGGSHLDEPHYFDRVFATVRYLRPRLIAVDPLVEMHTRDENSEALKVVLQALRKLQEAAEASLVLTHHTGKVSGEDMRSVRYTLRGTSALSGWYDGALVMRETRGTLKVYSDQRYGEGDTLGARLVFKDDFTKLVPTFPGYTLGKCDDVLRVLRTSVGAMTLTAIAAAISANHSLTKRALEELEEAGRVRQITDTGRTRWEAVEAVEAIEAAREESG